MKKDGGGTLMHCPYCKDNTELKKVDLIEIDRKSGQRVIHNSHSDLHYFLRARYCFKCRNTIATTEVDEEVFFELVELRDILERLKSSVSDFEYDAPLTEHLTNLQKLVKEVQNAPTPWAD